MWVKPGELLVESRGDVLDHKFPNSWDPLAGALKVFGWLKEGPINVGDERVLAELQPELTIEAIPEAVLELVIEGNGPKR